MLRYNPEHDEPDAKLESGTWQDQMHMLCYSIIKQDSKAMTLNISNTEYIFLLIFIYNNLSEITKIPTFIKEK